MVGHVQNAREKFAPYLVAGSGCTDDTGYTLVHLGAVVMGEVQDAEMARKRCGHRALGGLVLVGDTLPGPVGYATLMFLIALRRSFLQGGTIVVDGSGTIKVHVRHVIVYTYIIF
jgi:hypothetical protein